MASAAIDQVLRHLDKHRPSERTLPGLRAYVDAMTAMEPEAHDVAAHAITVGGVRAERVTTPGCDETRTLLYFHGGGYAFGSASGYRPFTGRLARAFGGAVVTLDYRLAPEHPFPAGLDDAVAACRALLPTTDLGKRLVLGGDSAGGGLALAAMVTLRDAGDPLPAGAALLSPWVDLEGPGESMNTRAAVDPIVTREGMRNLSAMYVGDAGDRRNPLVSPTHARLAGLPPLLMHTGTREVQYDDAVAFVAKVRAAGVPIEFEAWEGMLHVFQIFPVLPEAGAAIGKIGGFLRARTGA